MAQVIVTIDGRSYRMACEQGQEPYIQELASDLDTRVQDLREQFGAIGDMRLLLMSALILSDDLRGMRKEINDLREENRQLKDMKSSLIEQNQREYWQMSKYVTERAERLENLSDRLSEELGLPKPLREADQDNEDGQNRKKDNSHSETIPIPERGTRLFVVDK